MEYWIHETCLISAVASGPTEPKTFQEAWHSPVEEERQNWQIAIRKEIKSMINRGVWRKIDKAKIPEKETNGCSKSNEIEHTEQDLLLWDAAKFQGLTTQTTLPQWHMMFHSG